MFNTLRRALVVSGSVAWFAAVSLAGPTDGERAASLAAGAPGTTPLGTPTALETYIHADDGAFAWTLEKSTHLDAPAAGTWSVLRMTSQVWRAKGEVNIPEWTHWVHVWVPDVLRSDKPILFITGGRRKAEVPDAPAGELGFLAKAGAIAVVVDNIPNQPMQLGDDPTDRTEDGLVARSWVKAMETGDPTWIARFPMVKGATRAMDAATAFLKQHPPANVTMNGKPLAADFVPGKWMVSGASKRGWTTWLTAAADARVGALAPIVIDVLDIPTQMRHHHAAYGFWSPALNDYVETKIVDRMEAHEGGLDPLMAAVLAQDDPINWLSRVGAKPKYLINASGDEFFLPDSSRFYEDRLPRPWGLRYVPNSGHNVKESDAPANLVAFYLAWAEGRPMPQISWKLDVPENTGRDALATIHAQCSMKPTWVRLWRCGAKKRDFRIEETGKEWQASHVGASDAGGLDFDAPIKTPDKGFTAAFLEFTYKSETPGDPDLVLTSRVLVLPDRLRFERGGAAGAK
ncbi:MAG: PhoPQ-activated protein PqaA family protein [Phycisphaerales bacterium]|jgi:PhoPQ-activated pathogenicity-related protein